MKKLMAFVLLASLTGAAIAQQAPSKTAPKGKTSSKGLPTGKRQHKPLTAKPATDKK